MFECGLEFKFHYPCQLSFLPSPPLSQVNQHPLIKAIHHLPSVAFPSPMSHRAMPSHGSVALVPMATLSSQNYLYDVSYGVD